MALDKCMYVSKHLLAPNLGSFLDDIWIWSLYMENKERLKKAGDHQIAGGRFESKGTYILGLSWAAAGI